MRPGCTAGVYPWPVFKERISPVDEIYPVESIAVERVPAEIRDWFGLRGELVDIWRVSYEEFSLEYARDDICQKFPRLL
jgi:hypothetical protein